MAFQIPRRILLKNPKSTWSISSLTRTISSNASTADPIRVTLFPGQGIGPEIAESVKQVLSTAEVPIEWEEHFIGENIDPRTESIFTWESLESVRRNGVGLKGPMDIRSLNDLPPLHFTLRKEFDLYANVRPFNSVFGDKTDYKDVNLVTIRENPKPIYIKLRECGYEDEATIEENKNPTYRGDAVFSEDFLTKRSMRVADFAFNYAKTHGRTSVSAIHEANIVKMLDGIFLECCREVAKKYPEIEYQEVVIEKCRSMLLKDPSTFDVLLMPNYHAFVINDFCDSLFGGFASAPCCNIGEGGIALAEAMHDHMPDIAGKNIANPTPLLLSSVMMLQHLKLKDKADQIQNAIIKTISEGKYRTADVGGTSTTTDFTNAICDNL